MALLAKASSLAVYAFAFSPGTWEAARVARSAGDALAGIAILHLAMRAAPPGREAFGAILLAGVAAVMTAVISAAAAASLASPARVAWFATGAAIAAALAVRLLPGEILRSREGLVIRSPS